MYTGKNSKYREGKSIFDYIQLPAKLLDHFYEVIKATSINKCIYVNIYMYVYLHI